jgi:hypothetical protein
VQPLRADPEVAFGVCFVQFFGSNSESFEIVWSDWPVLGLNADGMAFALISQQADEENHRLDWRTEIAEGVSHGRLDVDSEMALEAPHEEVDSVAVHRSIVPARDGLGGRDQRRT